VHVGYPPQAQATREKVQAFLAEHLPADWSGIGALEGDAYWSFVADWRRTLHEHGWLGLSWPERYGGAGLSDLELVVVAEEFAKSGVPTGAPNDVFGIQMLGNTLLHFGTEEQRDHFLPRILSGEYVFCQGYSEPNAGSDLAGLGTRAVRDGDEWIINGQKIWTSGGHTANWMFVLCRTDPDAPPHKGITFLLCPMDQPGVEIRPIRMISGESEFNEVFFDDARASNDHVVGSPNEGWRVAMALLGFERGERAAVNPIVFRTELDRLMQMAADLGKAEDPHIRERLVRMYEKVEVMRFMGYDALTKFLKGTPPSADAAITKIFWSEYHREVTDLAVDILGMDGLAFDGRRPHSAFATDDPGAPNLSGSWSNVFLNARAGTIYAGTSEIQRNIAGEMLLGLPKEPVPRV
jgi:alkylation response protein AidB-like acyl-CoA dehydrogenase